MEALVILVMIGKSLSMHNFNSHVGIGSSSHDLLGEHCILDRTSFSIGKIFIRNSISTV